MAGGDEGSETFVARMGGDVDASAAEDVVVGGEDGGWGVGVGVAHGDGSVIFSMSIICRL